MIRGAAGGWERAMKPHESDRRGPVFHVYTGQSAYAPKTLEMRMPHGDKLKALEIGASARTFEGLFDAETEASNAVGDIYYARQLFQVGEEGWRDGAISSGGMVVSQRDLRGCGFRACRGGE